jgi:hypothetical protein
MKVLISIEILDPERQKHVNASTNMPMISIIIKAQAVHPEWK